MGTCICEHSDASHGSFIITTDDDEGGHVGHFKGACRVEDCWAYGEIVCRYYQETADSPRPLIDPNPLPDKDLTLDMCCKLVESIPPADIGWWKSSSQERFGDLLLTLVTSGMPLDSALSLLSSAYYATANCYGS